MTERRHGVVAAGHPLTAEAGAQVLREGGNAVDAAVAAMLTSFVAEPLLTGPRRRRLHARRRRRTASRRCSTSSCRRRRRPRRRRASAELLAVDVSFGDAAQVFHIGPASCGVYGTPGRRLRGGARAGARSRWRSSPRRRRGSRARACALNAGQAYVAEILADLLTSTPECAALWAPAGRVLREGELLRNPELGDALERLGARAPSPSTAATSRGAVCDWLGARGGSLSRRGPAPATRRSSASRCASATATARCSPTRRPRPAGSCSPTRSRCSTAGPRRRRSRAWSRRWRAAQAERTPEFLEGLSEEGFLERFLVAPAGRDHPHLGARRRRAGRAA